MDSLLLSRITKDFLNLDPDLTLPKDRYRAGWGGSVLVPHEKAERNLKEKKQRLLALREQLSNLFAPRESPVLSTTLPKLPPPVQTLQGSFRPAHYFCRGLVENDRRKNPDPIPYLLMETNEISRARPVPGNLQMLRSLCKGKGVLKKNEQGLVYLDIDNRFISMILPYLKARHLVRPPYFNLFSLPEGAHIPVIPARESRFHYLDQFDELGKEFSFEIEGLYSMEPNLWPEVEQVWFFKIRSEDLEKFRKRYLLTEHPGGNPFHAVVAVKAKVTQKPHTPLPTMRINIGFLAA